MIPLAPVLIVVGILLMAILGFVGMYMGFAGYIGAVGISLAIVLGAYYYVQSAAWGVSLC